MRLIGCVAGLAGSLVGAAAQTRRKALALGLLLPITCAAAYCTIEDDSGLTCSRTWHNFYVAEV